MAQLLGVKIRGANNYKGLMTIGTDITEGLTTTLKAVGDGMGGYSPLQLSTKEVGANKTVALSAGATNEQLFNLSYNINNSGAQTGTFTGILMNATETALNGMGHNLMDLQVDGVSKFRVSSKGIIIIPYVDAAQSGIRSLAYVDSFWGIALNNGSNTNPLLYLRGNGNGKLGLYNSSESGFDMVQFGGTTNAFPALKRNGAEVQFILADNSNTTTIKAGGLSTGLGVNIGTNYFLVHDVGWYRSAANEFALSLNGLGNVHFNFRKTDDVTTSSIIKGSGDPEGNVTAATGSMYLRTSGGAGTTLYIKETGSGNTGWVGK